MILFNIALYEENEMSFHQTLQRLVWNNVCVSSPQHKDDIKICLSALAGYEAVIRRRRRRKEEEVRVMATNSNGKWKDFIVWHKKKKQKNKEKPKIHFIILLCSTLYSTYSLLSIWLVAFVAWHLLWSFHSFYFLKHIFFYHFIE